MSFIFKNNKSLKIFIIFLLMFTLSFTFYEEQKVNAVVGVDDAIVIGGVTVTSEAIFALVGTTLVAGGATLYANVDSTDIKYIAQGLIDTGNGAKDLAIKVDSAGKQFLTWTKDGAIWFGDKISSMVSAGVISSPVDSASHDFITDSVSIANFTADSPLLISPNVSLAPGSSLRVGLRISGTYKTYTYSNTGTSSKSVTCGVYNNSSNYQQVAFYVDGVRDLTYYSPQGWTLNSSDYTVTGGGSICYPVSSSISNYNNTNAQDVIGGGSTAANTGSISYQPSIGVPIADSGTTASDGTNVYNPDISIPYGKTWGDISGELGISYPKSIPTDTPIDTPTDTPTDTTGEATQEGSKPWIFNIPILGDILAILKKILDFLLSMIKSFITALATMLTSLFVPDATYFQNKFDGYRTTLIDKLGNNNLDFLKDTSGSDLKDIYIDIFGQHVCIVKVTLYEQFRNFAYMVIRAFFYYLLILFNYNQIIKFLRGSIFSDYDSRATVATAQQMDNVERIDKHGL